MNAKASVAWLDVVFNHYLSMDPEVEGKVSAFDGKVIAVDVQGLDSRLYLLPSAGKIEVTDQYDAEPDTALKGAPSALFRMSLSDNVAPMMLRGEIEISGDVRLGREFKKLLSEIEIDWEDHLARLTGDVTANQLMKFGNNMASWIQRAVRSLEADVSEYLQEESRDIVSGAELEMFYQDVDELRNDVDRLEARYRSIKKESKQTL